MAQTDMAQSRTGTQPEELGFAGWFAFWGQLIVLGFLAIVGAYFAGADAESGDYSCGLILTIAAILLAFLRLKARFDGAVLDWSSFLFVDDMMNLLAAIVVFVLLGLAGLFMAADSGAGGLYAGGVALAVVSAVAILLSTKRVFDNLDRHRR